MSPLPFPFDIPAACFVCKYKRTIKQTMEPHQTVFEALLQVLHLILDSSCKIAFLLPPLHYFSPVSELKDTDCMVVEAPVSVLVTGKVREMSKNLFSFEFFTFCDLVFGPL